MAYTPSELRLLVPSMKGDSPALWSLQGDDAVTTVRGANFITDAQRRGLKKGDLVLYTLWNSITTKATVSGFHQFVVLTVGSSGADLTDGSAITITNT